MGGVGRRETTANKGSARVPAGRGRQRGGGAPVGEGTQGLGRHRGRAGRARLGSLFFPGVLYLIPRTPLTGISW